jgi:hypothetical protein
MRLGCIVVYRSQKKWPKNYKCKERLPAEVVIKVRNERRWSSNNKYLLALMNLFIPRV